VSDAADPSSKGQDVPALGQRLHRAALFLKRLTFRVSTAIQGPLYRFFFTIERMLVYVYEAIVGSWARSIDGLRNSKIIRALWKNTKRLSLLIAIIALIFVLIRESIFTIDYDFDGVIVRLGAYNRTVSPGINFMIPGIERLFVVNTEDRRQEHFGFIQFTPPPAPMTDFEAERKEDEDELLQEHARDAVDSAGSGSFVIESQRRGPRTTADYIVETAIPEPEMLRQEDEEDEVRERIKEQVKASELLVPPSGKVPVPEEMKMIAGDLNIVYLTYSVQYEIIDARAYLFNAVDVKRNLRDLSQVAIRISVGDRSTEAVLSGDRKVIESETLKFLQVESDRYRLGLRITNVIIQDANPPDQVKTAFHQVNAAKQEMENTIHQAESEYNSTIPQMTGKAERAISEANAYRINLLAKAQGESERFLSVLEEYQKAPEVIRTRYYLEALEELHEDISVTLIDPSLRGILPVFSGDANGRGELAQSSGVLQHAHAENEPSFNKGQHAVTSTNSSEYGPAGAPSRLVDPPGPGRVSGSEPHAHEENTHKIALPKITEVEPASVTPTQVQP
jgi:HflK protein